MRALIAYLLSIAIFVGGAYASLAWLAEPVVSSRSANSIATTNAPRSQRPKARSTIEQPKPNESLAEVGKFDDQPVGIDLESGQKTVESGVHDEPRETAPNPSPSPAPTGTSHNNSVSGSVLPLRKTVQDSEAIQPENPASAISKRTEVRTGNNVRTVQRKPDLRSTNEDKLNPKTGQRSPQSRLVMMTLRTIEFPDGHREQRLLSLSHSGLVNSD
jgi:hypothetical protein